MEIFPGCVNRSLVSFIWTLSILFLMISYRILPAPSTSNFLSSARKLIEIGVLCARINCVVFIGWLNCLHNSFAVSYTHLRAHETGRNLVCRLLLEKKK